MTYRSLHTDYKPIGSQTDDSTEHVEISSFKPKLPALSLRRHHAVHVKDIGDRKTSIKCAANAKALRVGCASKPHIPDYRLTKQFLKHPLFNSSNTVVRGFIRQAENNLSIEIPADIAAVCTVYFVHPEDKLFQLAYKIFTILQALNKPAAPIKLFYVVISKYLDEKDPAKLKQHFDDLKRFDYIDSIDASGQAYEISMVSKVCFQAMTMRR